MELLDKIVRCEDKYALLTSMKSEYITYTTYTDDLTPDFIGQNFTYIKSNATENDIKKIIIRQLEDYYSCKKNFLRIIFDPCQLNSGELPELSDFNFQKHSIFTFELGKSKNEFADRNCFPIDNEHKKQYTDLYRNLNKNAGYDETHINRWLDLKFSVENLSTIVYSKEGKFIGNCELFFYDGIVKLEDFEVFESYREKGVGDAILMSAISISKSLGYNTLYLICDSDSWVSSYYYRRGFELIAEYYSYIIYS